MHAIKGVNLAIYLKINFLCVYHWFINILTGKTKVSTKAVNEMLIRGKFDTFGVSEGICFVGRCYIGKKNKKKTTTKWTA